MAPVAEDAASNPLSRKLQKILSLKLDQDPDLLLALKGLSSVVQTNNLRTRRNLRGEFEKRSVELSEELCDSFRHVNSLIDRLSDEITDISNTCSEMTEKLASSRSQMSGLLQKTSQIKHDSEEVEMKREVIGAFIERYNITPEQSAILRNSQYVNHDFFDVMRRIKTIHQDCKTLLQSHQSTGLQIMENMALEQETAYQTLYKWTQGECRHLTSEAPEATAVLREALEMLQDRSPLYNACIEELCKVRRAALLRMFINALTKGGPNGTPKAIELTSHDPIQYTGDMIAWLHQAIASERDFLVGAIGDKKKTTEGICRTLKIRVEQVLNNTEDCLVLLKVCNITQFYITTVTPFIGSKAPLIALLMDLKVLGQQQFNRYIVLTVARLSDRNELPNQDLVPTVAFQEALHLLKVVLNTHDISVVSNTNPSESMAKLLDVIVDPVVSLCQTSALLLHTPVDRSVYFINTLTCVINLTALYEHTDKKIAQLNRQVDENLGKLVKLQLDHIARTVRLPTLETVTLERLTVASEQLDAALCNAEVLQLHQCRCLSTLRHRSFVWERACAGFLDLYTALYNSPSNQDTLNKSPDQLKELLQ